MNASPPPAWARPPDGVMPGVLDEHAALGSTGETALALAPVLIYPNGIEFGVLVFLSASAPQHENLLAELHRPSSDPGARARGLVVGVEYADGASATNIDPMPRWDVARPNDPPRQPVLLPSTASVAYGRSAVSFWLWPLPDHEDLTIFAEWRSRELERSHVVIPGAELEARARAAWSVWDER